MKTLYFPLSPRHVRALLQRVIQDDCMSSYTPVQKLVHWSVLVLCLGQIPTSWAINRTHMAAHLGLQPSADDLLLHQIHALSGWLILVLAGVGFALRLLRRAPRTRTQLLGWALLMHLSLYGLLGALITTGTAAMYVSGVFAPVHAFLTKVLLAFAILHSIAALAHHFLWRDGVLTAMLPRFGRR